MLHCRVLFLDPWEKLSILVPSVRRERRPTISRRCLGKGLRGRLLGLEELRVSRGERKKVSSGCCREGGDDCGGGDTYNTQSCLRCLG